jgi:hypothetical protein
MHKLLENINGWVQDGPMGNDKQLLWLPQAIGVASQLYGAVQAAKKPTHKPLSPAEIRGHMAPVQGIQNQMMAHGGLMRQQGLDLMDPTSGVNQQQYQMMSEQGQNTLALQHLLARRQAASMGQVSGISAAQTAATTGQTARNLGQQYQQALGQNRQMGMGQFAQGGQMLGRAGQMQMGISENIAQSAIAQRQHQMQEEQRRQQMMLSGISGLGTGLMQWGQTLNAPNEQPIYNIYNTPQEPE